MGPRTDQVPRELYTGDPGMNGATPPLTPEQVLLPESPLWRVVRLWRRIRCHRLPILLVANVIIVLVLLGGVKPFSTTTPPAYGASLLVSASGPVSPAQLGQNLSNDNSLNGGASSACYYLEQCRWSSVDTIPEPPVGITSIGNVFGAAMGVISGIFFAVAGTVLSVIGLVLREAMSGDFLMNAAFVIDKVFYETWRVVSNVGVGDSAIGTISSVFGFAVILSFALVLLKLFLPKSHHYGSVSSAGHLFLRIFLVATLICIMAVQSQKNHASVPGESQVGIAAGAVCGYNGNGQISSNGSGCASSISGGASALNASLSSVEDHPSNWAALSPGWLIAETTSLGNDIGGVAATLVNSITSATDFINANSTQNSDCARYIGAMHDAFQQTGWYKGNNIGAGKGGVLIDWDNLENAIYFQPYIEAAFGNSQGAKNSWCRTAEIESGSSTASQVMLARDAGLYSNFVGVGGLGACPVPSDVVVNQAGNCAPAGNVTTSFVTGNGGSSTVMGASGGAPQQFPVSKGNPTTVSPFVCANGNWNSGNCGLPPPTVDDSNGGALSGGSLSGYQAATLVFGPTFSDSYGPIASEYYFAACTWRPYGGINAPRAELNSEWSQALIAGGNNDPSGGQSSNNNDYVTSQTCNGTATLAAPGSIPGTSSSNSDGASSGSSSGANSGWWDYGNTSGFLGLFGGSTDSRDFLQSVQPNGGNPALDLYQHVNGNAGLQVVFYGLVALGSSYLAGRYMGPIILGSMLAEILAIGMMLLLVLILLVLLFPSKRTTDLAKGLLLGVLFGTLVSTILVSVIGLLLGVISIFSGLFIDPTAPALIQSIETAAVAYVGFRLVRMFLSNIGYDMSTFRGAVATTAAYGARPFAERLGVSVPPVLSTIEKREVTAAKDAMDAGIRRGRRGARDTRNAMSDTFHGGRIRRHEEQKHNRQNGVENTVHTGQNHHPGETGVTRNGRIPDSPINDPTKLMSMAKETGKTGKLGEAAEAAEVAEPEILLAAAGVHEGTKWSRDAAKKLRPDFVDEARAERLRRGAAKSHDEPHHLEGIRPNSVEALATGAPGVYGLRRVPTSEMSERASVDQAFAQAREATAMPPAPTSSHTDAMIDLASSFWRGGMGTAGNFVGEGQRSTNSNAEVLRSDQTADLGFIALHMDRLVDALQNGSALRPEAAPTSMSPDVWAQWADLRNWIATSQVPVTSEGVREWPLERQEQLTRLSDSLDGLRSQLIEHGIQVETATDAILNSTSGIGMVSVGQEFDTDKMEVESWFQTS